MWCTACEAESQTAQLKIMKAVKKDAAAMLKLDNVDLRCLTFKALQLLLQSKTRKEQKLAPCLTDEEKLLFLMQWFNDCARNAFAPPLPPPSHQQQKEERTPGVEEPAATASAAASVAMQPLQRLSAIQSMLVQFISFRRVSVSYFQSTIVPLLEQPGFPSAMPADAVFEFYRFHADGWSEFKHPLLQCVSVVVVVVVTTFA